MKKNWIVKLKKIVPKSILILRKLSEHLRKMEIKIISLLWNLFTYTA